MKNRFICTLLFILFSLEIIYTQSKVVLTTPVAGDISTYKMLGYIAKGPQIPSLYLRIDYSIDNQGNIYIGSYITGKILKFNKDGEQINEISLPGSFDELKGIRRFYISNDSSGCLYVLLTENDFFVKVIKYSSIGTEDKSFTLLRKKACYIRGIHVDNENNLCIQTSPLSPAFSERRGNVFIYSTNGVFLKQTNNPYVVADYRVGMGMKNDKINIEKRPKQNDADSISVNSVILADVPKNGPGSLLLIGTDRTNKVFYFQDDKIKKINILTDTVTSIPIPIKVDDYMIEGCATDIHHVKIGPNGDVFLIGVQGKNFQVKKRDKYLNTELEYVVKKLN